MKKILSSLLMACCVILCFSCSGRNPRQQKLQAFENNQTSYVYVCTGGHATKYHSYSGCRGLSNCSGTIAKMPECDAIEMGRTRCKICFD